MHRLKRLLRRLSAPFRRGQLERDITDEFRLHIEMETEARVRAGLSPAEARRTALRDFGGVERFSDDARATRGALWFDHITRDLRHGLRALGRAPAFSAVAIVTLALGIGANTAMFSVVNGVLLRPLPYVNPEQVVLVWRSSPERGLELPVAFADYREWRASSHQFSDLAVWNLSSVTVQGTGDAERTLSQFASANLMPLLGVQPVLGRFFTTDEEERKEHVAVISHSLWQRRFAGRQDVLGQSLELSGDGDKRGPRTVRVVGVLPAGFYFPNRRVDVWEPAARYWRFDREFNDRGITTWNVAARLQRNASVASAHAELRTIARRLEATRPVTGGTGTPASDVRVVPILDYVTGKGMQNAIWILLGAVSLVLLIACANVANLLLARGAARERELATRTALGASRGRVLAQLLAETAALVAIALLPAVAVAGVAVRALTKFAPAGLPRIDEIRVDGNVLLFTILVAVFTGVVFGLAPAWKLSHTDPRDALSESNRSSGGLRLGRVRSLLVISECALAIALLACSGLLIRSLQHVRSVELGYNPEHVLLMRVSWPPGLRGVQNSETWGRELVERVKALPGVQAAATSIVFMRGSGPDGLIVIENQPTPEVQVAIDGVGPGFFETVGTPILRGREPDWGELSSSARLTWQQPAVINQALARVFFGNTDPIGKRIHVGDKWVLTVTGVVGDMRRESPERPPVPQIFFGAVSFQVNDLLVRTSGDPLALAPAIRDIIRKSAATAVILSSTTLSATVDALTAERRFQTWLLALFALLALILAVIGVYGVVHYAVAQRMRELSIRMAMGARASDVLTLVVKQGLRLAALGSTIGVLAALAFSRLIAHQLFGVTSADPVTYLGVIVLLLGTALLACVVPAARAARLAPALVLKGE